MQTPIFAAVALALSNLLFAVPLERGAPPADVIVKGRVTAEGGQALFGANVTIEAFSISVGTDAAGNYSIVVPARERERTVVLRARLFGYAPQVRSITIGTDTIVQDFELRADENRLSQVVVTGTYGAAAANLYTPPAATQDERQRFRNLRPEQYAHVAENGFISPRTEPLSAFGVDVDRASYSNVRRIISQYRQQPPTDAVRIEEFINYFPYEYAGPRNEHPFAVHTDVAPAPWAPHHLLVRIGLQAREVDLETAPPNNLVFLIDVSGSMSSQDKLPLLKDAFRMLVRQLREQDRVAIVTYAGAEGLALESTSGIEKDKIIGVIDRLESGGSTAGGAGIRLAYDIARANYIRDGNNRVILATDGDFNVGITDNRQLERYVTQRREEGTALTVLGFGAGNIHDNRMELLADKGNGNYAFIDTQREARKVLVHELGGTLLTVAKDVKLQVEFNPAVVASYRLIGYENRMLATQDFRDDRKDAGDMGAGHSVTALYEIIPVGAFDEERGGGIERLRYSAPVLPIRPRGRTDELLFVKLRYKAPDSDVSVPFDVAVANRITEASEDFRFIQAVAAFGMVLRDSEHRGSASTAMAIELANSGIGRDQWGYREDFVKLVREYERVPGARVARRD
jgi:Ca-activated chloride channel family protein